ncbi:hypothetical protein HPB50_017461 [Hyalomma asiaticum]|uniref:Uncharacterized protein n=1 Tax=Hyalomma asiaticum TaxID=266040 RepID=A0ACB7RII2_HYAAI|nr:hypothetical protein HPB50_017461 [Hyalomma asiaticum]
MPSEPRCQPSTAKSRNAEYEEYLRNLRNWETSIKMKDAQLRSLKSKLQPATGNRLFKDGRYDEAIESYGIGIECDPQNPVLYANRAMAFLRKNM